MAGTTNKKTTTQRTILRFTASLFLFATCLGVADAQFGTTFPGLMTLPDDDFTWQWGDFDVNKTRRRPDFSARGNEARFDCELTADLRPGRDMSQSQIRDLERSLIGSMSFIQASVQLMNSLEYSFDLDWGQLACTRIETETDAEKQQEQLDRAIERAERERERRRARRDR